VYTIALDASVKGAVVVGKILEQDNIERLQAENFISVGEVLSAFVITLSISVLDTS
jgi:hypothetical protein